MRFSPFKKSLDFPASGRSSAQIELDCSKLRVDACHEGLWGSFVQSSHDFSLENQVVPTSSHFKDASHWSEERRGKIKRFRFVISFLGLIALALSLMTRMLLNVAIVEMTTSPTEKLANPPATQPTATVTQTSLPFTEFSESARFTNQQPEAYTSLTTLGYGSIGTSQHELPGTGQTSGLNNSNDGDDKLRYDWSADQRNFLLASFYIGYAPCMLFSGSLADKYGSKWPLFVCVMGSALINMFTPYMAGQSYTCLIASRIVLGVLQGGVVPACYALFKQWLSLAETSIFAPMIKVSLSLGGLLGSSLAGITAKLGYHWPAIFYLGSIFCLLWSIVWLFLATNSPNTNRFVMQHELDKVARANAQQQAKPAQQVATNNVSLVMQPRQVSQSDIMVQREQQAAGGGQLNRLEQEKKLKSEPVPWLLILANPSVLALALVKFTYNLSMDFIFLLLPTYLKQIHMAPITTISMIASVSCFVQMIAVTPVAYVAKVLVIKRAYGLSPTKWRKIFQGFTNFSMAALYLSYPLIGHDFNLATAYILAICLLWTLGAGGESMVPYELSHKYPATIMGLVHSFSILSGILLPGLSSLILGKHDTDPVYWHKLFLLVGASLFVGGLVFVLFLKSKPFLPGERIEKSSKPVSR